MGEVYRARDTKLDREVALKVLPEAFTADPDRLARFEREAKVLASLNHPNIGGIHGLEESPSTRSAGSGSTPSGAEGSTSSGQAGVRALVLELVEGPTLADRIAAGPLAADDALAIARQIADALEAAHEQGVIHRDLKPANIKVRPDGTVKVLDFGLAKAFDPEPAETAAGASLSPTVSLTAAATQMGMVVGTAAYMAPEQAKGLAVDKRADIWAFGAVLFEMLTGRRLFDAADASEMLASVLVKDPDISSVGRQAPASVVGVLRRCLVKDPKRRMRDIGDVRLLLDEAEAPAATTSDRSPPVRTGWLWPVAASLGLVSAFAMAAYLVLQPPPPTPPAVVFEVSEPLRLPQVNAISPDGRQLLFLRRPNEQGGRELWVRSLDSFESRPVPGTDGAYSSTLTAVWSPDSRSVLFTTRNGGLHLVELQSGQTTTLVEAGIASGRLSLGVWGPAGTILYGRDGAEGDEHGIWMVSASGGRPSQITSAELGSPQVPTALLPDGRRFLYIEIPNGFVGQNSVGMVRLGSLDLTSAEQDPSVLLETESPVSYVAGPDEADTGHLVFERSGRLLARPFDPFEVTLGDEVIQLADDVGLFAVAVSGALSYIPGEEDSGVQSRLVRFDRAGREIEVVGPLANYGDLELLPDGRRLAVTRTDPGEPQRVQIADLVRGAFTLLNPGSSGDYASATAPDDTVAFTYSPRGSPRDIYLRAANGVGEPRALVVSDTVKHPNGWSPDGQYLIYDDHRPTQQDLFVVRAEGGEPIPFLATEADETVAEFSPDGRWIAYRSDESGRAEVYVRDFAPDRSPAHGTERVQITVAGGDKPRWSPDGSEIFFLAPDGALMAVPVESGVTLEAGTPERLFQTNLTGYSPYDVMPDGSFIANTLPQGARAAPTVVMLNWQSRLDR